jgi:hypothetical protein
LFEATRIVAALSGQATQHARPDRGDTGAVSVSGPTTLMLSVGDSPEPWSVANDGALVAPDFLHRFVGEEASSNLLSQTAAADGA